jgi:hypothetical protein
LDVEIHSPRHRGVPTADDLQACYIPIYGPPPRLDLHPTPAPNPGTALALEALVTQTDVLKGVFDCVDTHETGVVID